VDDQPQAAQRALALDPGDEVVRQLDPLRRAPEDELAGMDDERLSVADRDVLGEVGRRVGQVDRLDAEVVEDPERRAEPEVDADGSSLITPSSTRRRIVPSDSTEVGMGPESVRGG
jgi:hypothetical protein